MKRQIPFNIPYRSGNESRYLNEILSQRQLASGGNYSQQSQQALRKLTGTHAAILTTSCTHALEMCAILLDIKPGDEVIMSSFTFVSAANAFVLRGAKIVFVDIRPDTLNIDECLLEPAITKHTKAILLMHYGGYPCEMDRIVEICSNHNLTLIEDAAHCIGAYHQDQHLGTIGALGTLSFHYTKNIHCGEGGALLINDDKYLKRAEILRDKGTNRAAFLEGEVDRYTWVDVGSSYSLSELNAAMLTAQLEDLDLVNIQRRKCWTSYWQQLQAIGATRLPRILDLDMHNGHLFYVLADSLNQRRALQQYLSGRGVATHFHYVPLHTSVAGQQYGRFCGEDVYTTMLSNRLLRLPLYFDLTDEEIEYISRLICRFYESV